MFTVKRENRNPHKTNLSTLNDVYKNKQNKVRYKMNKKSSPEKVNFLMQKSYNVASIK